MGFLDAVIHGTPDTFWTNTSTVPFWQLSVAGINTCGRCWALDGKISRSPWYTPLHEHCRCRQYPVAPGATATLAFVDYRRRLETLPIDRRVRVVGASTYALIRNHLITWDDVVLTDRVRPLAEVLDLFGISTAKAVAAGVMASTAKRAADVPHADAATWAARAKESLESMLKAAAARSAHPDGLLAQLERAAKGIAVGVAGATVSVGNTTHAQELAALMMMDRKRQLTREERAIVSAELGSDAASSVDAMLSAVAERRRASLAVSEVILAIAAKYDRTRHG